MIDLELNSEQQRAAQYEGGNHVLVLAGAGTGKTRTIIARIIHLVQTDVKPWRILLLTFTRRAAGEMIDRMRQVVGAQSDKISAGTFHHFSLYTMRRMSKEFGLEKASVIDRDDQTQLIRMIRDGYKSKHPNLPKAAEVANLYSYARNTVQPLGDYLEKHTEHKSHIIEVICNIAREYENRKQINQYLDYDDILFRFAEKLGQDDQVRNRLREAYDHILVDEMQDTNPLQWQILDQLKDPPRLFCVGDDAQSIYAFRGADFRNVHSFKARVANSEILRLEENYRSTQGILDLSNWLLNSSSIRYGKHLSACRTAVSKPKLMTFYTDFHEARWIAEDLLKRRKKKAPWGRHMILTRTAYAARTLESFMIEAKIPYRFVGGASLLQAAHIRDLLSLIRAAINHLDELAWIRYLKLWPRIGDATALKMIATMGPAKTTDEALQLLRQAYSKRADLIDPVESVRMVLEQPELAIKTAADSLTPKLKTVYDNWNRRLKDFQLLARMSEHHSSIAEFIEAYTLEPVSTASAERMDEDDVVTLITVHSAKGTEADVCYLIRVEPGMYPHSRSIGSRDDEEEERRILYVAMTRARDELIITRTVGQWEVDADSYFFQELDEGLVDIQKMSG